MNTKINFKMCSLFVFIIFTWGLGWPANKVGLAYMSPLWYTAVRMIVGTATMMMLVIMVKKFSLPKRQDFPLIFIIGVLQISLYMLLKHWLILFTRWTLIIDCLHHTVVDHAHRHFIF